MKGDIIKSWQKDGTTYVKKHTKYGTFEGTVVLADEDTDIESTLDGYQFAEAKCDILAAREKAKAMYQRAVGAENALKTLDYMGLQNPDLALDEETLNYLDAQVRRMYAEAKRCKEIYQDLKDSYYSYIEYAQKCRRTFNKRYGDRLKTDE